VGRSAFAGKRSLFWQRTFNSDFAKQEEKIAEAVDALSIEVFCHLTNVGGHTCLCGSWWAVVPAKVTKTQTQWTNSQETNTSVTCCSRRPQRSRGWSLKLTGEGGVAIHYMYDSTNRHVGSYMYTWISTYTWLHLLYMYMYFNTSLVLWHVTYMYEYIWPVLLVLDYRVDMSHLCHIRYTVVFYKVYIYMHV